MSVCVCCGQPLPDQGRLTVDVDDELIAQCNLAYEEAARRRSPTVEIAHLVWCLTRGLAAAQLGLVDETRDALAAEALAEMVAARMSDGQASLKTSAEFKALLQRAEQVAKAEARHSASARDVISVLMHRVHGFKSAAFVHGVERTLSRRQISEQTPAYERQTRPAPPASPPGDQRGDVRDTREALSSLVYREDDRNRLHRSAAAYAGDGPAAVRHRFATIDRQQERRSPDLSAVTAFEPPAASLSHAARGMGAERASNSDMNDRLARLEWQAREQRALIEVLIEKLTRAIGEHTLREAAGEHGSRGPKDHLNTPPVAADDTAAELDEPDEADLGAEDDETAGPLAERPKRFYLALDDEIVKAPSIGPRTAARLTAAGVRYVRDLLACDAATVAARTHVRHITPERIELWKAQAHLVCTVPWLRGIHAQLLVGAGFDTLAGLSAAETGSVCAAVLRFAMTREGQSVLRSNAAPPAERVARWKEFVGLAEPDRAKAV